LDDATVFKLDCNPEDMLKTVKAKNDDLAYARPPFNNIFIDLSRFGIWVTSRFIGGEGISKGKIIGLFSCMYFSLKDDIAFPFFFSLKDEGQGIRELHNINAAFDINKATKEKYEWLDSVIEFVIKFLILLNCRNIRQQQIIPSDILQKKRIKNKKKPLCSYYILQISEIISSGSPDESKTEWHNRLHFVRGHFKHCKSGIYWWDAHLRGSISEGVIDKDYGYKFPAD